MTIRKGSDKFFCKLEVAFALGVITCCGRVLAHSLFFFLLLFDYVSLYNYQFPWLAEMGST